MAIVTPGTYSMVALMSEITNDPKGLGYASLSGDPSLIADRMNTAPEPIAAGSQEQIFRNRSATNDLIACLVLSEVAALTQANRDYLAILLSTTQVNTGDANVRTQALAIFAAGTASRTNLTAAVQRQASRSEALWGDGFRVTGQQVYLALHPAEQ